MEDEIGCTTDISSPFLEESLDNSSVDNVSYYYYEFEDYSPESTCHLDDILNKKGEIINGTCIEPTPVKVFNDNIICQIKNVTLATDETNHTINHEIGFKNNLSSQQSLAFSDCKTEHMYTSDNHSTDSLSHPLNKVESLLFKNNDMKKTKKKCNYLLRLLNLDSAKGSNLVAADELFSTNITIHQNSTEALWRSSILKGFIIFRNNLNKLTESYPYLTGEYQDFQIEERQFIDEQWYHIIKSECVSIIRFGVNDSVRSVAVLNASSRYMNSYNHYLIKDIPKLSLEFDITDGNDFNIIILSRVFDWIFSALASLDKLQSLEANVAFSLQLIRRCCRWLILNNKLDGNISGRCKIIELIIENFFEQR